MKTRRFAVGMMALAMLAGTATAAARAQEGLPLPPSVEKDLAAKASDVTEVTLGKNMLDFASKFMKDKNPDDAQARKLIQGLKGIYVREYTFDKEGEYSMEQVQQLRAAFTGPEWAPIVHERERKSGETTDVLMKTVNGETQGMFVLTAAPKELTIVLILGPIKMDELGELRGLSGLGALGAMGGDANPKLHARPKPKDGAGGPQ